MIATRPPLTGPESAPAAAQRIRLRAGRLPVPHLYGQMLGLVTLILLLGLMMVLSSSSIASYDQTQSFFSTFRRLLCCVAMRTSRSP